MKQLENREDIILLVDTFYKKATTDHVIGHFFTEVIQLDFEKHMPKMYDFWETTLFHVGAYKGNPMQVHHDLSAKSPLKKEHFDQWLKMWLETIDELFEGPKAESAKQRATSIATMMQIKVMG
ncbi:MAG: group III truncated hemoglobin [Reichenbachiella sp.]